MAAALAKVLRGGRSGLASGMLPAIGRRVPQESTLLGSPAATPAASMGRLIHTGQWRNPALSRGGGGSTMVPAKMEQFSSRRSMHWWREGDDLSPGPPDHPVTAVATAAFIASLINLAFTMPAIYRSAKALYRCYEDEW